MTLPHRSKARALCAASLIAMLGALPAAPAAAKEAKYNVTHKMTIKPNADFGGDTWQAGWRYVVGQVLARETDAGKSGPKTLKGQTEPFAGADSKSLTASAGSAVATATSAATASGLSPAQPFTGSVTANGSAAVNPPPGKSAFAFGASSSYLVAGLKRTSSSGAVSWNSVTSIIAAGCTSTCVSGADPISFFLEDPDTGDLISGDLLDIGLEIDSGTGSMTWANGVLSIASGQNLSGSFFIDMSSPYTAQHGALSLKFLDNMVVHSEATGIYAGLAPTVGSSALGDFTFGEQEIAYDFGYGDRGLPIDFAFGNSGTAVVGEVPEPGTWALLLAGFGLLGGMLRRRRAAPALPA